MLQYLGHWIISFSQILAFVRNPYDVMLDWAGFLEKIGGNAPAMRKNGLRIGFWIYWKIWSLIFSEFGLWRKFILFGIFTHKSHILEKSEKSGEISEIRVKMLLVSLEQNDEMASFFACWYKFMETKHWDGFSQKWVLPLCSQNPRIGFISKRNKWGKLIFCILIQTHEN